MQICNTIYVQPSKSIPPFHLTHFHRRMVQTSISTTPHPHYQHNDRQQHTSRSHSTPAPGSHNHHDALVAQHEQQHADDEVFCKNARAEAEKLFDQRHHLLDQQKKMWDAGDHAGAKHVSQQAHEIGARAEEEDQRAAEIIFAMKQTRMNPQEIDLHGLKVDESIGFLKKRLTLELQKAKNANFLVVIYGAGHHSVGGVQKIKPAVLKLLEEEKLHFQEDFDACVGKPNHGCVSVYFAFTNKHPNVVVVAASSTSAEEGGGSRLAPHAGSMALAVRTPAATTAVMTQPAVLSGPAAYAISPASPRVEKVEESSCVACCSIM